MRGRRGGPNVYIRTYDSINKLSTERKGGVNNSHKTVYVDCESPLRAVEFMFINKRKKISSKRISVKTRPVAGKTQSATDSSQPAISFR